MTTSRLNELFDLYIRKKLLPEEELELMQAIMDPLIQQQFKKCIDELYEEMPDSDFKMSELQAETIFQAIIQNDKGGNKKPVRLYQQRWFQYAASILLIPSIIAIGISIYRTKESEKPVLASVLQDIAPGSNKALLTLSDGTVVAIDSSTRGNIALQGNTQIRQLDNGELAYQPSGGAADQLLYNKMTTPRGGQIQLILPDGTKVWLNAASSIRYPTSFNGPERKVEVTGEVYFEVAQDADKPFKVNVDQKADVLVLGTSFNINAYENETSINTTLLKGAIKVAISANTDLITSGSREVLLKPGQQAQIGVYNKINQTIKVRNELNLKQVMAWKNGVFEFESSSLSQIMKQLERWYDITVVYEKKTDDIEFEGSISRNIPLQQLLKELEFMGIHSRLESDRRLIILP